MRIRSNPLQNIPKRKSLTLKTSLTVVPRTIPTLYSLFKNPFQTINSFLNTHGDLIHCQFGKARFYVTSNPILISMVLKSVHTTHPKNRFFDELRPLIGNGLLTSSGETWREQRASLQPLFSKERLAKAKEIFETIFKRYHIYWRLAHRNSIKVVEESNILMMKFLIQFLFEKDLDVMDILEIQNCLKVVNSWHVKEISKKPFSGLKKKAYLDALARLREIASELSSGMPSEQILTFLFAGSDTLASVFSWSLLLLAWHKESRREDPRHIMHEAIRLFPPVYYIGRKSLIPFQFDNHQFPANSSIDLFIYGAHRHPGYWSNPNQFKPERFREKIDPGVTKAFFPYGQGRVCIGNGLSELIVPLALSLVLEHFEIVSGSAIEHTDLNPTMFLSPPENARVSLWPR